MNTVLIFKVRGPLEIASFAQDHGGARTQTWSCSFCYIASLPVFGFLLCLWAWALEPQVSVCENFPEPGGVRTGTTWRISFFGDFTSS